jgi:hypothetical protein
MHWIWGESGDSDTAIHPSARPFRKHERTTKTAAEIQEIADEMIEAIKALIWWQNYLHGSPSPPSHGTPTRAFPPPIS